MNNPQNIPPLLTESIELLKLRARMRSGANWFFWIAAASVLTTIALIIGTSWGWFLSLGITQLVSVIASGYGSEAKVIAFVVTLVATGIFVLLGVFSRKRQNWAFIVGMILYGADGLLFFMVNDWLSIGFHVWALFGILGGLRASLKMKSVPPPPDYSSLLRS